MAEVAMGSCSIFQQGNGKETQREDQKRGMNALLIYEVGLILS